MPHSCPDAVHRSVAASDNHNVLAPRIKASAIELRNGIAKSLAVGSSEVVQGRNDVSKARARSRQFLRLVNSASDQNCVVPLSELRKADVGADLAVQHELHTAILQLGCAPHYDMFLQLESRNAVGQETARTIIAVVNDDPHAGAPEPVGSRQTTWTRADDADGEIDLLSRRYDFNPSALPSKLGKIFLHGSDHDGAMPGLLDHAVALA